MSIKYEALCERIDCEWEAINCESLSLAKSAAKNHEEATGHNCFCVMCIDEA